jgi:nitrate reductase gamma subunit
MKRSVSSVSYRRKRTKSVDCLNNRPLSSDLDDAPKVEVPIEKLRQGRTVIMGLKEAGVALALCAYMTYLAFIWKIGVRLLMLRKAYLQSGGSPVSGTSALTVLKAIRDIFLLSRLFRVNPCLWFAEFLFHASFVLVILRHLRYVMEPVPAWVVILRVPGELAGYILPLSLGLIVILKILIERKEYISSYNFFLLSILFFLSVTGFLMKIVARPDIVGIKYFMISVFKFAPVVPPCSLVFGLHYLAALILLAWMPAHIFAAPFSMMDARKREENIRLLMHER